LKEKVEVEVSIQEKSDIKIIDEIKDLIKDRPTYGYRRITALLNRKLNTEGSLRVNHKRVYRLMKENSLLLERFTGRKTRTHEGTVSTLKSNTRWCSDSFGIQCWNGDQVNVVFALDTCDREAMKYIATNRGVTGEMVRDLMVECLDYRFGGPTKRPPTKIQWLSDNGPYYTAHKTVTFGRDLGLEICTTPAYSPESNGMAEAFVKTFKRDYVWFGDLSTAEKVIGQLPLWFKDYNEIAPHKALKMKSPCEFLEENLLTAG
jgi:putative transposase